MFDPKSTLIDLTRPWLIDIGNDVQITRGVTILTHDYDCSVLKKVYGDVLGSDGLVIIENNVFIGMNTTILKETTISNNVISKRVTPCLSKTPGGIRIFQRQVYVKA